MPEGIKVKKKSTSEKKFLDIIKICPLDMRYKYFKIINTSLHFMQDFLKTGMLFLNLKINTCKI